MEPLSKRETQVADLIHKGFIDKEIAERLHISYETARTHRKNIHRKMCARNSADITRIFINHFMKNALYLVIALALLYVSIRHPEIVEMIKTSLIEQFEKLTHSPA